MQDLLVQTYSGKVMAFSEEEVGVYQGSRSTPTSPLKRLTSQLSKVRQCSKPYSHMKRRWVCIARQPPFENTP